MHLGTVHQFGVFFKQNSKKKYKYEMSQPQSSTIQINKTKNNMFSGMLGIQSRQATISNDEQP